MEIVTAVRKLLLASDDIGGIVGDRVFKHRLEEPVVGTGDRSLVVKRGQLWKRAEFKRQEFPLVVVACHSDSTRDESGAMLGHDCEDRAAAALRVVKAVLFLLPTGVEIATDVWLQSSQVWGEPPPTYSKGSADEAESTCEMEVIFAMNVIRTEPGAA